jgi:hypothetical protein
MTKLELLNKALNLIDEISREDISKYGRSWLSEKSAWAVRNMESYIQVLEDIFLSDKLISTRFSRKNVFKIIEDSLIERKKFGSDFDSTNAEVDFNDLKKTVPKTHYVTAPISGIRLDNTEDVLKLFSFEIGRLEKLEFPIANDQGYYISIGIGDSYDQTLASEKAKAAFEDFARLVVFLTGKYDKSVLIRTGLPLYPSMSHELMYVQTTSFQVTDGREGLSHSNINNRYLEKIPIDNAFFSSNEVFSELWEIHSKRNNNERLSDIRKRILNSALAVGESARSDDQRNSVIYSCIALETLFSFDEGSMFQKSIADRMADTLAFIVAKDRDSRIHTNKMLKKVYAMRSAIVHGGDKQLTNDYVTINILLRIAIAELLNNPKYAHVQKIDDIYEMVRDAHYSYDG